MSAGANEYEAPQIRQPSEEFATESTKTTFSAADIFGKSEDMKEVLSIMRGAGTKANTDSVQSGELVMGDIFLARAAAPVPPEGPKPLTVKEMQARQKAEEESQVEFPDLTPAHARLRDLAVKDKLDKEPLTLDEMKELHTERCKNDAKKMFPTDAAAQALYVKDKLSSSSYNGQRLSDTPLTAEEKEKNSKNLEAYSARKNDELGKNTAAPEPDEDAKKWDTIAQKKAAFDNGDLGAKSLTPEESAFYDSYMEFPKDKHFQKLAETAALHRLDPEKPGLNHAQTAELNGKREFPDSKSAYFANLAAKEELSINGKDGVKLTPEEKADLQAKREFPDGSPYIRALARKSSLAESGGPPLTDAEKAKLTSTKEFPSTRDSNYKHLAEKEHLSNLGGDKLTDQEFAALQSKREFRNDEALRVLAEQEHLFFRGVGAGLKPDEQTMLDAARKQPRR